MAITRLRIPSGAFEPPMPRIARKAHEHIMSVRTSSFCAANDDHQAAEVQVYIIVTDQMEPAKKKKKQTQQNDGSDGAGGKNNSTR